MEIVMSESKKVGVRDLVAGRSYLHYNNRFVRTIDAIEGDSVYWHDYIGSGVCSRTNFIRRCPTPAPPDRVPSRPTPMNPSVTTEFTLRDEANAVTAFAFRNGFLEDLHAGVQSLLLEDPSNSRLTNDEMKRLMIEASEKIEQLLRLKRDTPDKYYALICSYNRMYCPNWKRE